MDRGRHVLQFPRLIPSTPHIGPILLLFLSAADSLSMSHLCASPPAPNIELTNTDPLLCFLSLSLSHVHFISLLDILNFRQRDLVCVFFSFQSEAFTCSCMHIFVCASGFNLKLFLETVVTPGFSKFVFLHARSCYMLS